MEPVPTCFWQGHFKSVGTDPPRSSDALVLLSSDELMIALSKTAKPEPEPAAPELFLRFSWSGSCF